ncbi:hypothetical protein [Rhodocaloribacter sp.]
MESDPPFTLRPGRTHPRVGPSVRHKRIRLVPVRPRASEAVAGAPPCAEAERVRALAAGGMFDTASCQSVVVAVLRVLARVRVRERAVAAATMSLGQREKLSGMVAALDAVAEALREALSEPGRKMMDLDPEPEAGAVDESLWWYALAEALQALEAGLRQIASMVAGQPKPSAARTLAALVARMLRRHYHALLAEAEHWMG